MDDKQEICRARIQFRLKGQKTKIALCIAVLLAVLGLLVIVLSYKETRVEDSTSLSRYYSFNCFGEIIKYEYYGDVYSPNNPTFNSQIYNGLFERNSRINGFLLIIIAILVFIPNIYSIIMKKVNLLLHDKGITGNTSKRQLDLPMNKIDNILVKHDFLDTLRGGKTIVVRSASGIIKFPCVQNADEFMQKTLAEIQKWQDLHGNSIDTAAAPTLTESRSHDSIESIQKLKILLDQGLITQEEYETKRKELLSKI